MRKSILGGLLAAIFFSSNAMATSVEEKIEILQQEIEALKDQVANAPSGNKAGGIQSFKDKTTIGGYGELHYNNFSGGATDKDMVDFHRFVLFFGHRFNDWISFKSEFEIEHALVSGDVNNKGKVELEQAYLDFNINPHFNAKAGIFLIPLGMLNETHEPPTFFGVERNEIESRIIPSTWWEAGVGAYGEVIPGLNYQLNITSSLDAGKLKKDDFSKGFRDARRSVSEAPAENVAVSGALNYTGIPGLLLGTAFFTGATGQDGASQTGLTGVDARLTLWDVHARYNKDKFDIRALYARGHLDDAAKINTALGNGAGKGVATSFYGWYVEGAYHVWKNGEHDLAPFIRFEKWDLQDEVPTGSIKNLAWRNNVWTIGANYWPHPQIVLKADYQLYDQPDGTKGDKRFNLGLGYMF
ncbi:MAG: hypothetical protein ABL885_02060 [Methylophilaceae bacterium]